MVDVNLILNNCILYNGKCNFIIVNDRINNKWTEMSDRINNW